MKKQKKDFLIFLAISFCLVVIPSILVFCLPDQCPYDPDWILGKSANEIRDKYGEFYQGSGVARLYHEPGEYELSDYSVCYTYHEDGYLIGRFIPLRSVRFNIFYILFNENEVAIGFCKEVGPIGG